MKKKSEKIRKDVLAREFAKLHKVDKEIKTLDGHLKKKGFRPQKERKNFWGIKNTYEDKDKKVIISVQIQDYTKPKSKDQAAIGQITVAACERTEIYSFDLIAPKGKFKEAKEYRVDKRLKVLEAHSWWSCVLGYLEKNLPLAVITVLTVCSGTGAYYFACVAGGAGIYFTAACCACACNCHWACAWAVGCYRY